MDNSDIKAETDGSPITLVAWCLIYIFVACRAVPLHREIVKLLRANKFTVLLVLLAIVSTAWSVDPGSTIRRSIALLGTTLVGIDLAMHYSIHKILRLLCVVLGLFLILSVVVQVFSPDLIPSVNERADYAWHGLVAHKGNFAKMVVLGTVAVLCRPHRLLTVPVVISIAFALIFAAHSVEALIITAGMLVLFLVSGAAHWSPKRLAVAALASLVLLTPVVCLLSYNLADVTAMLGRDVTLTGRITLWRLTLTNIVQSPILGYGYSAFWSASSPAANLIRSELNWDAPHAHNGFIDLTLALGLVGLLLFVAGYIVTAWRALQLIRRDSGYEAKWPIAFLILIFLYQITESTIVVGNSLFWIMYVAVSFSLAEISVPVGIARIRSGKDSVFAEFGNEQSSFS